LIQEWSHKGFRIGTIKHDGHDFELDIAETDTWKHRKAGAHQIAITSKQKTAIFKQQPTELSHLIQMMSDLDILIVEGFKQANYQKVLMTKTKEDLSLLQHLTNVIAIVSWFPLKHPSLPVWNISELEGLSNYLMQRLSEVYL
jgi:molybdopterin-guanine dinucleotide biosynthesis protein B